MDIDKKYDHYDFPTEAAEPQDGHAGHLTGMQIAQVHQLRMMLEAEGFTARLDTLTLVCNGSDSITVTNTDLRTDNCFNVAAISAGAKVGCSAVQRHVR